MEKENRIEVFAYDEWNLCDKCEKLFFDMVESFFQPERSKREDLDCCKRLQEITDMAHRYEIYAVRDVNYDIVRIHQYLIQEAKMRCSEHCGNTVRDK